MNLFFPLLLAWPLLISASDGQPCLAGSEVIPFEHEGLIFVTAIVNREHPARLVYDPIEGIILTASFAEHASLDLLDGTAAGYGGPVYIGGAGADRYEASFARDVQLGLPGLEVQFDQVTVIPETADLDAVAGTDVDGLLGTDVFGNRVVEIDFAGKRFLLHAPEAFVPPADAIPLTVHDLCRNSGGSCRPTIKGQIKVGNKVIPGRYLLDFGMVGGIRLTTRHVDAHGLPGQLQQLHGSETTERGLGGELQSLRAMLPKFELYGEGGATIRINNYPVSLARESSGADADSPWDGLIGLAFLSRYRVYWDRPGKLIWLLEESARK